MKTIPAAGRSKVIVPPLHREDIPIGFFGRMMPVHRFAAQRGLSTTDVHEMFGRGDIVQYYVYNSDQEYVDLKYTRWVEKLRMTNGDAYLRDTVSQLNESRRKLNETSAPSAFMMLYTMFLCGFGLVCIEHGRTALGVLLIVGSIGTLLCALCGFYDMCTKGVRILQLTKAIRLARKTSTLAR